MSCGPLGLALEICSHVREFPAEAELAVLPLIPDTVVTGASAAWQVPSVSLPVQAITPLSSELSVLEEILGSARHMSDCQAEI